MNAQFAEEEWQLLLDLVSREFGLVFQPRAAHKRGAVSHMLSLPEICQLFAARSDDP
jgi:hypothetical protein